MKTKERGITLIALVVTIIVLLILAGISIMMLTGQSGILNQARAAKEDTRGGEVKDEVALAVSENTMADYTGNGTRKSRQEVIDQLHKEGKLTDDEVTWLEEHDQITIGSIEIDFSSLGETSERLEDMYYLVGDYNDENGQIENIRLSFIPEAKLKIVEENKNKFELEEEDLVNRDLLNKYIDEDYNARKIYKKYSTAKELYMEMHEGMNEEEYKKIMKDLRIQYECNENISDEEVLLIAFRDWRWTKADTFEGMIEELYNLEKYTTAREYYINSLNWSEEDYNKMIATARAEEEVIIENSGTVCNEDTKIPIREMGKINFTVKIDGKFTSDFTININQYEIIGVNQEVVAYDFINEKILTINCGECTFYRGGDFILKKELTTQDIRTEEGIRSFIRTYYNTNKYKLMSDNIVVKGYYYSIQPK